MKELFNALGGLARNAATTVQSGGASGALSGLGGLFQDLTGAKAGQSPEQQMGGTASPFGVQQGWQGGQGGQPPQTYQPQQAAPANQPNSFGQAPNGQAGAALGGVGGMLGSAALGGVFGMLLTSKQARKVASSVGTGALAVGGGAAVAALAWSLYKKWSNKPQADAGNSQWQTQGQVPNQMPGQMQGQMPGQMQGQQALAGPANALSISADDEKERQASLLMQAMVFAARSDGHVDEQEKGSIKSVLDAMGLGNEVAGEMNALMSGPIDPASLAARVRSPEEARDIYRLSCLVMQVDHFMERSYLDALGTALALSRDEQASLEAEAAALRDGPAN